MRSKKRKKAGSMIIPVGTNPEDHELDTVKLLVKLGIGVEFLVPSRLVGQKTADVRIKGEVWELKSPKGSGKYNIQHAFKGGAKQSKNLIFDLRRSPLPQQNVMRKLQRELRHSRYVKRVMVITNEGNLVDING